MCSLCWKIFFKSLQFFHGRIIWITFGLGALRPEIRYIKTPKRTGTDRNGHEKWPERTWNRPERTLNRPKRTLNGLIWTETDPNRLEKCRNGLEMNQNGLEMDRNRLEIKKMDSQWNGTEWKWTERCRNGLKQTRNGRMVSQWTRMYS